MNTLKAKITISCDTCCAPMRRTKQIKVSASDQAAAIAEAKEKITVWSLSLKNTDCYICKQIKKDYV